jgi:hypothetical protein
MEREELPSYYPLPTFYLRVMLTSALRALVKDTKMVNSA